MRPRSVVLTVSYNHVKEFFFQKPTFGFYFLQLISKQLFKDIERLQQRAAGDAGSGAASSGASPSSAPV